MTIQAALSKIRSNNKWYYVSDGNGDVKPKTSLISCAQRIEDGRAKPETIKRFFNTFGFTVDLQFNIHENNG